MTTIRQREDSANESVAAAQKISMRALQLAASAMIVVILVLTVSLGVLLGLNRQARSDAKELADQLACRSEIATIQADAHAALSASIADALLSVAKGEDIPGFVTDQMDVQINDLRRANDRRNRSVEICVE